MDLQPHSTYQIRVENRQDLARRLSKPQSNRIGFAELSLPQLKIMQEAITVIVFVPFAVLYMKQPIKLDYLWASLCIVGAVYFVFRG